MEMLSEHLCQGWLEGYLLTGRHGLFNCYEAFIHIVDSMFNQHAKWLKVTREHPVAAPDRVAQLPAHLARLAPGPQRLLATRTRASSTTSSTRRPRSSASTCRRTPTRLLSVADHCLRSRDYVNVIVAGKQPRPNWLSMDEAIAALHPRARHLGVGRATTRAASPTSCSPAPATSRRSRRSPPSTCSASTCPTSKVRVVNVVDLMRLQPAERAPARPVRRASSTRCSPPTSRSSSPTTATRGSSTGSPTAARTTHNLHVRGYKEEGTTTTPFDMVMLNDLDRFHLVMDVIDRVPGLGAAGGHVRAADGRRAPRGPRLHAARARTPRRSRAGPGRTAASDRPAEPGCRVRPDRTARILVVNAGSTQPEAAGARPGRRPVDGAVDCRAAARRHRRPRARRAPSRDAGRRRRRRPPDRARRAGRSRGPVRVDDAAS